MILAVQSFLSLAANYSSAIFPVQVVFIVFGIIALYYLFLHKLEKNLLIGGILTFLWIWMVIVYNIMSFPQQQVGSYLFGLLFITQGIFFFLETFQDKNLIFELKNSPKSLLAVFFILYGLIIYPVLSYILNGTITVILNLGLPAPTIVLTFGFLMLTNKRFSRYLLIIPTFCAVVGTAAIFYTGMFQDIVLLVAAVVANAFLMPKRRSGGIKLYSLQ